MNKKGQMNVGEIVLMIMIIVVGLALVQAIFTEQTTLTTKSIVTDETVTCSSQGDLTKPTACWNSTNRMNKTLTVEVPPTGWQLESCPLSNFVITNSSGSVWTKDTDYAVYLNNGTYRIWDTTKTNISSQRNNITKIDYTYCQDGYNNDSGSRGIAGIIGLFSAFMLLAGVLYYVKIKDLFD